MSETEATRRTTLEKALMWLMDHPDSSARDVALGIGEDDHRHVFHLLDQASFKGRCSRIRIGSDAWLWKVDQ